MRHFLTIRDFPSSDVEEILALAADLKRNFLQGKREPILQGRVLGLLFSKPSLRTRVSFEAGIAQLGGSSLYLGTDVGWMTRESPADFARVISQYLDFIVCRTHAHQELELLAQHSACSVINGLTNQFHPCQAVADLLTLRELKGELRNCKLAYIGDGNNVARSLALACDRLGVAFVLASPKAYQLDEEFFGCLLHPDKVTQTDDPTIAVSNASAIYTDVWSSMGDEDQTEKRRADFIEFQVNARLMSHAPADVIFLHCLPAHRGEEVTDDVIDGPNSAVIQQAANRLHAQKGLLVWLANK